MGTVCFAKENALRALYLAGTQATRAYVSGSVSTAGNDLNSSDVGFPSSVGLAVRVRNLKSVNNAFSAEFAFCHNSAPPIYISSFIIYKHSINDYNIKNFKLQ